MAEPLEFAYLIDLPGGRLEHVVRLDPVTLQAQAAPVDVPVWAQLEFHGCPGCPLAGTRATVCPLAHGLAELFQVAGKTMSYDQVHVEVRTALRSISADTSAQRAFGSLIGLVMATSGCPEMDWLRPMARFHLPFANEEETIYRAAAMYLVAQYFRQRHGGVADLDLAGLQQRYRRLQTINQAMVARLREASEKDGALNAVIFLDMFAKALPWSIEDSLQEIEYLFRPWLADLMPVSPGTG